MCANKRFEKWKVTRLFRLLPVQIALKYCVIVWNLPPSSTFSDFALFKILSLLYCFPGVHFLSDSVASCYKKSEAQKCLSVPISKVLLNPPSVTDRVEATGWNYISAQQCYLPSRQGIVWKVVLQLAQAFKKYLTLNIVSSVSIAVPIQVGISQKCNQPTIQATNKHRQNVCFSNYLCSTFSGIQSHAQYIPNACIFC